MDQRLLFVLQRAARAASAGINARMVEKLGVSIAQLGTLSHLAERPGSAMTDIADLFDLNKSAVSSMIVRLERAGLVRRTANPKDGRGVLLHLTPKGSAAREDAKPVFRRAMAEMTADFSPEELAVVLRFLNAVIDRYGSEGSTR